MVTFSQGLRDSLYGAGYWTQVSYVQSKCFNLYAVSPVKTSSILKRRTFFAYATTWVSLEYIVYSEVRQSPKDKHWSHLHLVSLSLCQRLERGGGLDLCLLVSEFPFRKKRKFQRCLIEMNAHTSHACMHMHICISTHMHTPMCLCYWITCLKRAK